MKKIPVYNIDTGVPIPKIVSMPLQSLEVGESFLFPLDMRRSVQTIASRTKRLTGKEYTVKKMDDNVARIWRKK